MSQHGLETIESTTQKTHEWIARVAEAAHVEKRDAYKALRAILPSKLPIKMSREEFLAAVQEKIVADSGD
jgi:hypothetical protein